MGTLFPWYSEGLLRYQNQKHTQILKKSLAASTPGGRLLRDKGRDFTGLAVDAKTSGITTVNVTMSTESLDQRIKNTRKRVGRPPQALEGDEVAWPGGFQEAHGTEKFSITRWSRYTRGWNYILSVVRLVGKYVPRGWRGSSRSHKATERCCFRSWEGYTVILKPGLWESPQGRLSVALFETWYSACPQSNNSSRTECSRLFHSSWSLFNVGLILTLVLQP